MPVYTCDQCERPFNHKTSLTRHLREKHQEKPKCQYCRKKYSVRYLAKHEATCSASLDTTQTQQKPVAVSTECVPFLPPLPPTGPPPPDTAHLPRTDMRVWTNADGALYCYILGTSETEWLSLGIQTTTNTTTTNQEPIPDYVQVVAEVESNNEGVMLGIQTESTTNTTTNQEPIPDNIENFIVEVISEAEAKNEGVMSRMNFSKDIAHIMPSTVSCSNINTSTD